MNTPSYKLHVEWSDEDACYVGTCSDLFEGGCHGDSEDAVREELAIIVEDVIEDYRREGKVLPEPSVRVARLGGALKARRVTQLNQAQFARAIGVKVGTLRNWEQGRVKPKGAARTLLSIIEENPNVLKSTLSAIGSEKRGRTLLENQRGQIR